MDFNIMDLMNGATRAAVEGVDNYEAITLNLDEIKVTKHNRYSMDDLEELATSILMDGLQVITRSNGLCERCKARGIYKPGYIVHHKEYITPGNISNPNITLNLDNLEYVCEDCHNKEHKAVHTPMRYQYDANGNLLPPKENNKSDHTPGVQNLTPGKRTEGATSKKLRKVARI